MSNKKVVKLQNIKNMKTKPGFQMESSMFNIKFMWAKQKKQVSYLLEEETDWKEVMKILLNSLDSFPTNITEVELLSSNKLEEWALTQEGGDELQLKVDVKISEKKYYQTDSIKHLKLIFNDMFKTVVLFEVRRKQVMKTLRMLSAEMVSSLLNMEEEVYKLEIPTTLYTNIRTAFKDDWRMRTIDTSHMKRKVAEVLSNRFKNMRDCPYCGRANFKKLMSHILRNNDCHLQYKVQLEYDFVQNSCFW